MASVLIACEHTGTVRRAFRSAGHDAYSCDLLPATDGGEHIQGNALEALDLGWDLVIAHPPCTYLSSSGWHWTAKQPGRMSKAMEAAEFFMAFVDAWAHGKIARLAIENPIGRMSTWYRKPDQIVQPYQYGHDASKATCLWLHGGLPVLTPTEYVPGRTVNGRKRWANQTDSGQNRLPPSADRWALRSATYEGIAKAMATQWGALL